MKDYQKRVVAEREELNDRLDRLIVFLGGDVFPELSVAEQERLKKQAMLMQDYLEILDERIENF